MKGENEFEEFSDQLEPLDSEVRKRALEFAADFYASGKMTKAQALEKGISRAEIEKREL